MRHDTERRVEGNTFAERESGVFRKARWMLLSTSRREVMMVAVGFSPR